MTADDKWGVVLLTLCVLSETSGDHTVAVVTFLTAVFTFIRGEFK